MKSILITPLLLIAIIIFSSCSSSIPDDKATVQEMNHTFLLKFDSLKSEQVFDRTLLWLSQNFTSTKTGVTSQDKEKSEIKAKGDSQRKGKYISTDGNWQGFTFNLTVKIKGNEANFGFENIIPYNIYYSRETDEFQNERPDLSDRKEVHRESQEIFNGWIKEIAKFVKTPKND